MSSPEKSGTAAESITSGTPTAPPDPDVPDAPPLDADDGVEVEFTQSAEALAHHATWKDTYKNCVNSGKARVKLMRDSALRSETALAALDARNAEKEAIFWKSYTTEPTTNQWSKDVLSTRWNETTRPDAYYENTPDPKRNRIYSWQNGRVAGEPLQNSDIYYFQYKLAVGEENPIPPLELVIRQSAGAADTTAVNNHMRYRDNSYALPAKMWRPGEDDFYAMLGTANATAPVFLVVDHGRQLRIATIRRIDRDLSTAITYHYEQIV